MRQVTISTSTENACHVRVVSVMKSTCVCSEVMQCALCCRCRRLDSLCVHTLSRGGGERGQAAGHVGAAEGRVGGRAQGARDDQQRARQDGAHGGRGQAAGGRGRAVHHQPAGGLQRGKARPHAETDADVL